MRREGTVLSLAMVGAFALLCLSGLGYLAVSMGLEVPMLRQGWRLDASFTAAEGLVPQSDVDVSGVHAGRVVRVAADGQGGVLVSMVIDDAVRLREDTTATIRPKSLVGETYVQLVRVPASTAPYAPAGYRLPRRQTGQAVQIDDILNRMDPETRAAFSGSLRELGVALDGREGDVSAAIPPVEQAAEVLRARPAVAGALEGVPQVVVARPAPEDVDRAVRLPGGERDAAQCAHAEAHRCRPVAATVVVDVPQPAVGALPHRCGKGASTRENTGSAVATAVDVDMVARGHLPGRAEAREGWACRGPSDDASPNQSDDHAR